ncbi:MAG: glycosyltransferase family 2 protein [Ignavibacteriaceae bacterium]|jgi:GT2 family glycosyltransferase|nr:glycosyltransferase family 2 protein [Ignavibacteriaceae bacterium]
MAELPLVTVNILSYNRKDELRNTLTKVFEQDYKNIEVIVVDNASTDGSSEMVKKEFPSVQLIQMEKNIGIAGWNEGFKIARGKYVLVLDDDSYPDTKSIGSGVKTFIKNIAVGIIAFNIFNTKLNASETTALENSSPHYFIGCGAMIRKNYLDKVGYYDDLYFIYYNEVDLSIRMISAGFRILYLLDSIVFHTASKLRPESKNQNFRGSKFGFIHTTISYNIFLIKYFNLNSVIKYSLKWFINRAIIAVRYNFYIPLLRAYFKLFLLLPKILKKRNVMDISIVQFYDYAKIPFVDREYFPGFKKPKIWKLKSNS